MAFPERTSGMTARRIPGSSSGYGILSRRSTIPDTVYAGVEDAALFISTDGGQNWEELSGLRKHGTGPHWQPGAGGMCLHTILLDPANPKRIYHRNFGRRSVPHRRRWQDVEAHQPWTEVSPTFRILTPKSDTACTALRCIRRGPSVLFMQKHWDVMRSDDAGDSWQEVSGNLPTDFGFVIDVHAHEPETIYVVPIKSDSEHFPPTESCEYTAAAPAEMNGSRSPMACRRAIAT